MRLWSESDVAARQCNELPTASVTGTAKRARHIVLHLGLSCVSHSFFSLTISDADHQPLLLPGLHTITLKVLICNICIENHHPPLSDMPEPASILSLELLDLPNEVLDNVVEMVAEDQRWNGKGLRSFRQTCKQAALLVDPVWLRHVELNDHVDCKKLDLVLKAGENRQYHVEEVEINTEHGFQLKEADEVMSMLKFISRFPRVKRLVVTYMHGVFSYTNLWMETLNDELQRSHLAELQEFTVELTVLGTHSLSLARLLRAPKLKRLSIYKLDLTRLRLDDVPSRSTNLIHFRLWTCVFDEQSMAAILSKPRKLESLRFDHLWYNDNGSEVLSQSSARDEASVLRKKLRILAQEQPEVRVLTIALCFCSTQQGDEWKNEIRFGQLKNLRELNIRACSTQRGEKLWCPVHAFYDLTASIEHVKLTLVFGGPDFGGLVDALLDPQRTGAGLPVSLRHIEIDTGETSNQRPFHRARQRKDQELQRNIGRLMAGSVLPKLTYKQTECCWSEFPGGGVQFCHWIRKLTVLREVGADETRTSKLGGPYELTEMTWVEVCPDKTGEDQCR